MLEIGGATLYGCIIQNLHAVNSGSRDCIEDFISHPQESNTVVSIKKQNIVKTVESQKEVFRLCQLVAIRELTK